MNKVQIATQQGVGALRAPASTHDLLPSEHRFVIAMHEIGFGSFESVRIENGELALNPWPTTIRGVKFGSEDRSASLTLPAEFQLKRQVIEFLEYVRAVDTGEIRRLEIRHGLPFAMEVALSGARTTAAGGGPRG